MTLPVYDVVVIGAGICGLSAALELKSRGTKNILILEAEETVGGRARSMHLSNGMVFNEGANWFHGGDDNPFYQWAKVRYDLGPLVLDQATGKRTVIWKHSDDSDVVTRIFDELNDAYDRFAAEHPGEDVSVRDLSETLGTAEAIELIEFMAAGWMAMDNAGQISARDYFNDPLGPGGWQMAEGVDFLTSQMASDFGGEIRCGATVTAVQEQGDLVQIELGDGAVISTRYVISTVSPGVLSARLIAFDDKVQNQIDAKIEGLMMGNLIKVIVPVKEAFLLSRKIGADTPVYMVDDRCFIHARTAGKPAVTIFKGGQASRDMEHWNMAQIENFATAMFDKVSMLEGIGAARDGDISITRWGANPYSLGSYSVCEPHHKRPDPFACGRIVFTGEAFLADNNDSPGQMSGAWVAGRKAAIMLC